MVNTKNRGGATLRKGFTVYTNDPAKPQVRLQVSGKVKAYVMVEPGYVRLTGPLGQAIRQVVKITPLSGYPMTIKEVHAQKAEFVSFELQPLAEDATKAGYRLVVLNTKDEPGNYSDTIVIKTDSQHKPTLRIPVYGRIFDAPKQQRQQPQTRTDRSAK